MTFIQATNATKTTVVTFGWILPLAFGWDKMLLWRRWLVQIHERLQTSTLGTCWTTWILYTINVDRLTYRSELTRACVLSCTPDIVSLSLSYLALHKSFTNTKYVFCLVYNCPTQVKITCISLGQCSLQFRQIYTYHSQIRRKRGNKIVIK